MTQVTHLEVWNTGHASSNGRCVTTVAKLNLPAGEFRMRSSASINVIAVLLASFLLTAPSAASLSVQQVAPPSADLSAGESLYPGESLNGINFQFRVSLQSDGNLVMVSRNNYTYWNTGTNGTSPSRLTMQFDGNLVLYATSGQVLWYSGTNGSGAQRITIQDDGNLVMYAGNAVWNTGTRGMYFGPYSGSGDSMGQQWHEDSSHAVYIHPNMRTNDSNGMTSALNYILSPTSMNVSIVASTTGADVDVRIVSGLPSNVLAQTPCIVSVNSSFCRKWQIQYSANLNNVSSVPIALACHELGHTLGFGHGGLNDLNSGYVPVERTCLRGGPDVYQYAARDKSQITAQY